MVTRNKLPAAGSRSFLWTICRRCEIQTNTAKMQAMDKITGRVSVLRFGQRRSEVQSFSIVVRA
ncbi:MAG: hypothetical protein ACLUQJ_02040 [Alphaproteobacteria bacterium]